MKLEEAKNELQRRCNGLSNPNHVLQVALRMQYEIFEELEMIIKGKDAIMDAMVEYKSCDDCSHFNECPWSRDKNNAICHQFIPKATK